MACCAAPGTAARGLLVVVAVGTANRAKLAAVTNVVNELFPNHEVRVEGVSVPSGVADQPASDEEAAEGAVNRARRALAAVEGAKFGVGVESGFAELSGKYFVSGWTAVVDSQGTLGLGSSARLELSPGIVAKLRSGKELGHVVDELTGKKDVKQDMGYYGIVTDGRVDRRKAYEHAAHFAFARFTSDPRFWT